MQVAKTSRSVRCVRMQRPCHAARADYRRVTIPVYICTSTGRAKQGEKGSDK